jgi:ribosomal protein S18 acetylase RimI-like enzyme
MSATEPGVETERDPARMAEAVDWLAEHAHQSLGTEMVVQRAGPDPAWRILLSRRHGELSGVSASTPAGQWFLEATGPDAVGELVSAVLRSDAAGWPTKVTASGQVKVWLRPQLLECGAVVNREHNLLAMACHKPPDGGEGRWAGASDRAALERYQAAYNEERRTTTAPDWSELLRRPAVAVLEEDGHIVAVVKRTGDATRYATIGGTWTEPSRRRRGLAARVTAFIVGSLLLERPAVHIVVDDDNAAAIALYRSLGFEETGRCYMAYLSPPAAAKPATDRHPGP